MKKFYRYLNIFLAGILIVLFGFFASKSFAVQFAYNTVFGVDNYKNNTVAYDILADYIVSNNIKYGSLSKGDNERCVLSNCFVSRLDKNIYAVMDDLSINSFRQSGGEIIISHTRYTKGDMNNVYYYKKDYFKNLDSIHPENSMHELNVVSETRIIEKLSDDWCVVNYD